MIKFTNQQLLKEIKIERLGHISFLLGIFLLASALGIAIIFLLISLIISFSQKNNIFKDPWNYPFIASTLLMATSTLMHFNKYQYLSDLGIDPTLSLLGLVNWLPLFLCFFGFQRYLDSSKKRTLTAKLLICGSIPVIFSGVLQLLNINGPFEFFEGLVVWFQKPYEDIGSISGLFNNQNYAGLWMAMVWPFCLSSLLQTRKNFIKKLILVLICILFATFISMTDSRNAILGLIISSPIVMGNSSLLWYLPSIFLCFSILALTVLPIFPNELQLFMRSIVPSRIYTLFTDIGFENLTRYPRISKWIAAFNFVLERPLFGWGAASFPILYQLKSGVWFGHAHNLPLELAISYGILPSLIIFISYLTLLFLSFKKILDSAGTEKVISRLNEKAWFAASLIFFLSHLVDIQYFDARISILCWILLAGLRTSLKEESSKLT
tara:strand:+ start:1334 stop:2644 length:1311 start_codon:yes stop_codon:yes gene_type:complete